MGGSRLYRNIYVELRGWGRVSRERKTISILFVCLLLCLWIPYIFFSLLFSSIVVHYIHYRTPKPDNDGDRERCTYVFCVCVDVCARDHVHLFAATAAVHIPLDICIDYYEWASGERLAFAAVYIYVHWASTQHHREKTVDCKCYRIIDGNYVLHRPCRSRKLYAEALLQPFIPIFTWRNSKLCVGAGVCVCVCK